jgi:hypothetical protein
MAFIGRFLWSVLTIFWLAICTVSILLNPAMMQQAGGSAGIVFFVFVLFGFVPPVVVYKVGAWLFGGRS